MFWVNDTHVISLFCSLFEWYTTSSYRFENDFVFFHTFIHIKTRRAIQNTIFRFGTNILCIICAIVPRSFWKMNEWGRNDHCHWVQWTTIYMCLHPILTMKCNACACDTSFHCFSLKPVRSMFLLAFRVRMMR